jgi:hypothetical protein
MSNRRPRPADVPTSARRTTVPDEYRTNEKGQTVCGARLSDGSERRCRSTAVMQNGRCMKHGGMTPVGIESANTRTGVYSKDLPARLRERFEQGLDDPELLQHKEDAALLQAMIGEKLALLRESEKNPDVAQIVTLIETISANWRTWDWTRAEKELAVLKDAIVARKNEDALMREVRELIKERTAVVAQENKRLHDLDQMLTVDQGMLLMRALVGIVRRYVMPLPDGENMMRQIAADFRTVSSIREA